MKRFHFPLRPVAKLRAHLELKAREQFAGAMQAHAAAVAEFRRVSTRVGQLEAAVVAGRQGNFSAAAEARNLQAYRGELASEALANKAQQAAQATAERRRAEYLEAHQRLSVVERLEEKAHAVYRLEVNREEQAEFDDLAGQRAARKTVSSS